MGLAKWLGEEAYQLSNECDDDGERKTYLEKAYDYLKTAHQEAPADKDTLRCLCAATGRLAEESDVRNKIRLGFEFKDYLDTAIGQDDETDDDHSFELFHMRGRLAYTILTLPLVERFLAKTFGCLPSVTVDAAIEDLKKAAGLHPNVAENELFVAKCLMLKGDKPGAVEYLRKAASCQVDVAIEQQYVDEAKKLLQSIDPVANDDDNYYTTF